MGCGASNNTQAISAVAIDRVQSNPPTSHQPASMAEGRSGTLLASSVGNANKTRILISYHSNRQAIGEQLSHAWTKEGCWCHVLDENTPEFLNTRAALIQWCDFYVLLIDRNYHRAYSCMEALTYAKDIRKSFLSILVEPTFEPYGALGAISASALHSTVLQNSQALAQIAQETSDFMKNQMKSKTDEKTVIHDPLETEKNRNRSKLHAGSSSCVVLICTTDEGASVADLILEFLVPFQPSTIIENLSSPDSSCSVSLCTVFAPILNPQFETNTLCQEALEEARRLNKPIVPVISVKKWRPEGWLGLLIAGRTFFRIFDRETAYQPFYDSNRITDLRYEIEAATQPAPSTVEREEMEKKAIEKEINEIKMRLTQWPPKRKTRPINTMNKREPVRVNIPEPHATAEFSHTHYSYTRITRAAPPPLDDRGLPVRRPLDCMISYQWDKQDLVRQVFEDLHSRQVQTWFDIWGSMKGGTNDAMATGVECSKVLLVFLSKAYISSINCLLEFRYAVQRGKAFVILLIESDIPLEPWMMQAIEGFPQYHVPSYDVLSELINGVPMIDVIVQSIRLLAEAQPDDPIDDSSDQLSELRCLLDDARDALCAETGQQRYKTCTRCGKTYDEYVKSGCKKHAEYFLSFGGLMEDQWVCCRQQTADSPGCIPADHIDQPRVFVKDPNYGSLTWNPA